MNAAVLVKQVVGSNGEFVMDELSGMAVAQGVELCAAVGDGMCTAITIGPDTAEDVLREAIAWGRTCSVMTDGVLLADPAFDDSDTLAAARALATAITREGPFDLVLLGAESSDTRSGQLGPQVAELLDLPFVAAARFLSMQGRRIHVRGRHEDGWMQATVQLPAVVSCAADLADRCEVPPAARALVPHDLIRTLTARDLGPGPWGAAASPTSIRALHSRGTEVLSAPTRVPPGRGTSGAPVAALIEPDRPDLGRGLLGVAAGIADGIAGHVVAVATASFANAGEWGADTMVVIDGALVAEDIAGAITNWVRSAEPWAVLAPSTEWGREVTGRAAVRLHAGLAGNVNALSVEGERLVAWKRVGEDSATAEIVSTPAVQLTTVRPEALTMPEPRDVRDVPVGRMRVHPRGRVRVASRTRGTSLSP